MNWEVFVVVVSLAGMVAAWGVLFWCRRKLAENYEAYCADLADLQDVRRERDAAIKRAEQAERAVGRLRALRTRITEVLHEHDHPGTVEVVVNTMSKGAGDDD